MKMPYGIIEKDKETKLSFLKKNFSASLSDQGGEAWFHQRDKYEIDLFLKDCIDKHNTLSPAANMRIDCEDLKSVNERLLDSIQYQNKLLTEMLEILKMGSH